MPGNGSLHLLPMHQCLCPALAGHPARPQPRMFGFPVLCKVAMARMEGRAQHEELPQWPRLLVPCTVAPCWSEAGWLGLCPCRTRPLLPALSATQQPPAVFPAPRAPSTGIPQPISLLARSAPPSRISNMQSPSTSPHSSPRRSSTGWTPLCTSKRVFAYALSEESRVFSWAHASNVAASTWPAAAEPAGPPAEGPSSPATL